MGKSKTQPSSKHSKGNNPVHAPKPKRYELRALGYALEASAHKLSARQLKQLKHYAESEGLDLNDELGDLEGNISSYSMYETNMWQTTSYPIVGLTGFALFDSNDQQLFVVEDIAPYRVKGLEEYVIKDGTKNVLVAMQELKGTSAVWIIKATEMPKPQNFSFYVGQIVIGNDKTEIVERVDYKGQELERDYDEEMLDGKALSFYLL